MSSSKWRATQHRHRYTYTAVTFPPTFKDALSLSPLSTNPKSSPFFAQLTHLASLSSIYSQVSNSKSLSSSFSSLLSSLSSSDISLLHSASRFYLQLLFLENSLPLHRTLVSGLSKVGNKEFQDVVCESFRGLCEEYGGGVALDVGIGRKKRFCLSRVALSLMGMPKLGYLVGVVEQCAGLVAWDVVLGVEGVVLETEEWARPSPIVMEQCQEGLSCLYYLVQRFPERFKGDGAGGIMERVLGVLVRVLKSMAFSRDCFVAAGVSLCASLQVCLSAEQLGLFIMRGIFDQSLSSLHDGCEFKDVLLKVPFTGDLCTEIRSFCVLSRLCLIRGILTAVSRDVLNAHFVVLSDNLNAHVGNGNGDYIVVKTILYDGILPELCNYSENPTDSHFNFHVLTVMQICLQQMKTSLLSKLTDRSDNYHPIPEEMGTRILKIIWNNLEDPLSQTVKQVHQIFDLFLEIQSTLYWGEDSEAIKKLLKKIATDLLHLGPRCKGRYVPLALLTKRLSAKTLLNMSPNLLLETIQAYIDDDVCCAATTFLKCFLEQLRDECWDSDGIERGYAVFRGHCLLHFLSGLASGVSKLRSNLNTYALPVLLEIDVDSIFPMLAFISVGPSGVENGSLYSEIFSSNMQLGVEQKVAILVSLLKVCRSLALIEGDIDYPKTSADTAASSALGSDMVDCCALVCIKGIEMKVLVEWLIIALTHIDEFLRVDAAETLFLNPKTSSVPSHLELKLLKETVPFNMRSCSTGFQMKWTSLFRKFFSRVRTALERQFKQGSWQPSSISNNSGAGSDKGIDKTMAERAENLFNFMRWLSSFLFFSCYPSAPYKRKIMAMELILIMLNVWSIVPPSDNSSDTTAENHLSPYSKAITSPNSTLLLIGSIIDSWDRLRESSFRILLHFPTPLPGVSSEEMVLKMITWAKTLVCSPRVRESDAGALTMRLIFRKYVLGLGWMVRASVDVTCFQAHAKPFEMSGEVNESRNPVVEYIMSLIDWLKVAVEEGESNLSEACKNSFVHGVLLTLRYSFEELDWNSDAIVSSLFEMKRALEKLLELVMRVTSLALWVVSADAWYLPDSDDIVDDDFLLLDEVDVERPLEDEGGGSKNVQDKRPQEQIVMVGCWLAMKEVSLLLGTIIRKIPLPSNSCSDSLQSDSLPDGADLTLTSSVEVLDIRQLEQIGSHFLEVLLKMKHNGAIDKTRAGFTALCNRLLCSNDPRLCRLTESWMEQLMERTVAKAQVVDDLLRRSAGIPAAFIALFLSEPEGAPKKLLPRALRWLIDVATSFLKGHVRYNSSNDNLSKISSAESEQESYSAQTNEINSMENTSKIRDEGVIPTVHAFNVLRASFNDTNLATDTSGFAAEALIISIRSFSSPYWEVRNSACLAYTALVRRMIGFLNVQKRESARRALTGLEFFHRYPTLHPFLYNELKVATDLLRDANFGNTEANLAKSVHPSLCPMLIVLSRLKPSSIASSQGDDLDPFLFMPFIRKCSSQNNMRIRVLASKALTGLVSNEKLPAVLLNIASELPCLENDISATNGTPHVSFNSMHGTLLQLSSLVDANCRNLADFAKKEVILGELIQVVANHSWIAHPRLCPCPILNASYLGVLDHMLSISRTCDGGANFYFIRKLLLELSTECLDIGDSYGLSHYDPTIAEVRKQAVISSLSCVLHLSKEEPEILEKKHAYRAPDLELKNVPDMMHTFVGFQERLIRFMTDSSYEVRLATLKWLLRFLKSTESMSEVDGLHSYEITVVMQWTKSNLQSMMMNLLELEWNHRCTYYILRILFAWNSLQFQRHDDTQCADTSFVGNLDYESVFKFWDKLISLYKLTKHIKTKETLICCMAVCVKRYASTLTTYVLAHKDLRTANLGELERSERLYECLTIFVNLVKEHSSSSETVNMRKAAVESVIESGLLEQAEPLGSLLCGWESSSTISRSCFRSQEAVNMYASLVLDMWFICIRLLEDEDDGIRQALASNIQKCLPSNGCEGSSKANGVTTQVEKVIGWCFGYLSSVFGHWIQYFDYLAQWVLNAANNVPTNGDLVRRVFDKEIDNHHEEKLFICQICCSHLERLPILTSLADGPATVDFRRHLLEWRTRFCKQLTSFAKDHAENMGGVDWIGGVGNHKDAFLPLYANLLGFFSLSRCILNGEVENGLHLLFDDVFELGETLAPFLRNPLICNLYHLVVKLHEKMLGASADQSRFSFTDEIIRDNFDAYFLLR